MDAEGAAFASVAALSVNGAAVHDDELLHKREPDPKATSRTIQVIIDLGEELKYLGPHLGRYADAVIGHVKHDIVANSPAHGQIGSRSRGSLFIFRSSPAVAPPGPSLIRVWVQKYAKTAAMIQDVLARWCALRRSENRFPSQTLIPAAKSP
jgi:hypothetical protein